MKAILFSLFLVFLFSLSGLASESKLEAEDDGNPADSIKTALAVLDISEKSTHFVSKRQKNKELQLRYQLEEDLKLLPDTDDALIKSLSRSIFCIGTGRNNRALLMDCHHRFPTFITENDFCLDQNRRIRPDICVDAWKVAKHKEKIKGNFSTIYFAHVGHGIPLENSEALSCYFNLLEEGGGFLYKSYVVAKSEFKESLFEYDLDKWDQMVKNYTGTLKAIGFSRVQVLIKQEVRFGNIHEDNPSISLVVFALK
jgi:hypothetical protein